MNEVISNNLTTTDFLLSVNNWSNELSFHDCEDEKKEKYWKKYKDKKVKSIAIILQTVNQNFAFRFRRIKYGQSENR